MSFDDIAAEFNLDDLCPEIDNQLQGDFIDILGNNEFELGIFPEEDPDIDSNFIITCEFTEASGSINSSQVEQVKLKVTDALKNMIGERWGEIQDNFSGVTIYFNDDQY